MFTTVSALIVSAFHHMSVLQYTSPSLTTLLYFTLLYPTLSLFILNPCQANRIWVKVPLILINWRPLSSVIVKKYQWGGEMFQGLRRLYTDIIIKKLCIDHSGTLTVVWFSIRQSKTSVLIKSVQNSTHNLVYIIQLAFPSHTKINALIGMTLQYHSVIIVVYVYMCLRLLHICTSFKSLQVRCVIRHNARTKYNHVYIYIYKLIPAVSEVHGQQQKQ